ncbi:MAG TPA: hypothetical protein VN667_22820 [Burkholderiales bacterium]|nr:hypothetical protein [Burkholderiales bacterium]
MSENTTKLLQAASEMLGGEHILAERLAIDAELLAKYMADTRPLPDPLLLKIVDLILVERQEVATAEQHAVMRSRGIVA